MIIGLVTCECLLYETHSLKEKRTILQSILTRARQRFNVSASEIGFQDQWQRTKMAFIAVSSSRKVVENELQAALALIDQRPEIERAETLYEWL
ncbi:DUF503 family protein [Pullulanibacillus sp. KACC 23026]|uniref:DUF503 domain-containing protein n=1 Tax=Pullulanibacillus sp. KACC 23026 TaxID=3028315 RepID=UPI0023AEE5E5|nr:DUF503 family protein [Pullulanibacillus sp. KACC 23026]WEG11580.1 DUF503 family protein [Pullulanibacillus sp. KACC 23026]